MAYAELDRYLPELRAASLGGTLRGEWHSARFDTLSQPSVTWLPSLAERKVPR